MYIYDAVIKFIIRPVLRRVYYTGAVVCMRAILYTYSRAQLALLNFCGLYVEIFASGRNPRSWATYFCALEFVLFFFLSRGSLIFLSLSLARPYWMPMKYTCVYNIYYRLWLYVRLKMSMLTTIYAPSFMNSPRWLLRAHIYARSRFFFRVYIENNMYY